MTTGMYKPGSGLYEKSYSEKDYFLNDRFYPGELGMVILLMVASLLLWSVAIYGLTSTPQASNSATNNSTNAY